MSFFKFLHLYDEIWKALIMPPRVDYAYSELGPSDFTIEGFRIQRTDFQLRNKRGIAIECSYFEHMNPQFASMPMPCVIYLHANGCSRLEALQYMEIVVTNQMNYFCFDFSACGKSDGQYSTLGWQEQDDLEAAIQYLTSLRNVGKIGVWGRSMGAVTVLLYGIKKDNRISCFLADSCFTSFRTVVQELANKKASIPGFLALGAYNILNSTIKSKANLDLDDLKPIKTVEIMKIPAIFGHAIEDAIVPVQHTRDLYENYSGPKEMIIFQGDHNSSRPAHFIQTICEFFKKHLYTENSIESQIISTMISPKSINKMEFPNQLPISSKNRMTPKSTGIGIKSKILKNPIAFYSKSANKAQVDSVKQANCSTDEHNKSSPHVQLVRENSLNLKPQISNLSEKEGSTKNNRIHLTLQCDDYNSNNNFFTGQEEIVSENIPNKPFFTPRHFGPRSPIFNFLSQGKSSTQFDHFVKDNYKQEKFETTITDNHISIFGDSHKKKDKQGQSLEDVINKISEEINANLEKEITNSKFKNQQVQYFSNEDSKKKEDLILGVNSTKANASQGNIDDNRPIKEKIIFQKSETNIGQQSFKQSSFSPSLRIKPKIFNRNYKAQSGEPTPLNLSSQNYTFQQNEIPMEINTINNGPNRTYFQINDNKKTRFPMNPNFNSHNEESNVDCMDDYQKGYAPIIQSRTKHSLNSIGSKYIKPLIEIDEAYGNASTTLLKQESHIIIPHSYGVIGEDNQPVEGKCSKNGHAFEAIANSNINDVKKLPACAYIHSKNQSIFGNLNSNAAKMNNMVPFQLKEVLKPIGNHNIQQELIINPVFLAK